MLHLTNVHAKIVGKYTYKYVNLPMDSLKYIFEIIKTSHPFVAKNVASSIARN